MSASYSGFFELRTPRDLLEKARRDLERLRREPLNEESAFDFFVTVRHVPDWMEAQRMGTATAIFDQFVELRICRHLADGAKHFVATHNMHKQVQSTATTPGAFQAGAFQSDTFQTGYLEIELDPRDIDTATLGSHIDAITLGERVLAALAKVVP